MKGRRLGKSCSGFDWCHKKFTVTLSPYLSQTEISRDCGRYWTVRRLSILRRRLLKYIMILIFHPYREA